MDIMDPIHTPPEQEHDLFTDMEPVLVQADGGLRFANLIVDRILFMAFLFVVGMVLGAVAPHSVNNLSNINPIVDFLLTSVMFSLYIGAQEALLGGKTIAKYFTGTRAVNQDGSRISAATAFSRGLARAVPLEPFSALGTPTFPWHDNWTKTYVINEKKSRYFGNDPQQF
ncbi:MAG: hypothetical protein EOO15_10755 [Chitinophagaceae bacterium]|nr:MAG: hypothetical protein EOO15_10755 [Chitinophagaceae bacterium]